MHEIKILHIKYAHKICNIFSINLMCCTLLIKSEIIIQLKYY